MGRLAILPADWQHRLPEMQKEAGNLAIAGDLIEAGRVIGALGLDLRQLPLLTAS